ncbi:hypothetical protein EJB05_04550, partial [Eragrostis curvula]
LQSTALPRLRLPDPLPLAAAAARLRTRRRRGLSSPPLNCSTPRPSPASASPPRPLVAAAARLRTRRRRGRGPLRRPGIASPTSTPPPVPPPSPSPPGASFPASLPDTGDPGLHAGEDQDAAATTPPPAATSFPGSASPTSTPARAASLPVPARRLPPRHRWRPVQVTLCRHIRHGLLVLLFLLRRCLGQRVRMLGLGLRLCKTWIYRRQFGIFSHQHPHPLIHDFCFVE